MASLFAACNTEDKYIVSVEFSRGSLGPTYDDQVEMISGMIQEPEYNKVVSGISQKTAIEAMERACKQHGTKLNSSLNAIAEETGIYDFKYSVLLKDGKGKLIRKVDFSPSEF